MNGRALGKQLNNNYTWVYETVNNNIVEAINAGPCVLLKNNITSMGIMFLITFFLLQWVT